MFAGGGSMGGDLLLTGGRIFRGLGGGFAEALLLRGAGALAESTSQIRDGDGA